MVGIDRNTGKLIDNFSSAVQGVAVTFSTRFMSRVMRRHFGGGIAELLGRLVTPQLFAVFQVLLSASIDVWEPRFRVRRLIFAGSADELRLGNAKFTIEVDWRPRGHLGDETVESITTFQLWFDRGQVTASS